MNRCAAAAAIRHDVVLAVHLSKTVDRSNWTIRRANGIRVQASRTNRHGLMKLFLLKIFTWWNGQTFGTQLWTWRFGELVGADEQGNRYYRTKGGKIDP